MSGWPLSIPNAIPIAIRSSSIQLINVSSVERIEFNYKKLNSCQCRIVDRFLGVLAWVGVCDRIVQLECIVGDGIAQPNECQLHCFVLSTGEIFKFFWRNCVGNVTQSISPRDEFVVWKPFADRANEWKIAQRDRCAANMSHYQTTNRTHCSYSSVDDDCYYLYSRVSKIVAMPCHAWHCGCVHKWIYSVDISNLTHGHTGVIKPTPESYSIV